jgi:hypothetical protein
MEADGTVAKFAWPGGYRVWFYTEDGGTLCAECVQDNLELCSDPDAEPDWKIAGRDNESNMDEPEAEICDHCGRGTDSTRDESEL